MENDNSIFLRNVDGYTRDLDVIANANQMAAQYLHLETGKPFQECLDYVIAVTQPGEKFQLKEKEIKVLKRQPNGDRLPRTMLIGQLLRGVVKRRSILTPNLVVFDHPDINVSITGEYVDNKMANRDVVKHKEKQAELVKNYTAMALYANEQKNIKRLSNSVSGGHCSPHNPHYLKTGHSALTSSTRSATSYSNAGTERLIMGNRYYKNRDTIIDNILAITLIVKNSKFEDVINRYRLHIPTVDEVMLMVDYSASLYWAGKQEREIIVSLVSKLSHVERTAFLYIGDLHHLTMYNKDLIFSFIARCLNTDDTNEELDADSIFKKVDADMVMLVSALHQDILGGESIYKLKQTSQSDYQKVATTITRVQNLFMEYADLFQTIFVTDALPSEIYDYPVTLRRSVIGGDTDSTMFTVQSWVEAYFGSLIFTTQAKCVANVICYIDSQITAHYLAMMCKQIGVADRMLFRLKMKNEFSFIVYMKANIAKTYATLNDAREGNLYDVPRLDIKGVQLKDSKYADVVIKGLHLETEYIAVQISRGNGINIYEVMQRMANLEHLILESLNNGKTEFLIGMNVSPAEAYKEPMSDNYMHYDLWSNVFAHEFGEINEPPYSAIKLSVNLSKLQHLEDWFAYLHPDTVNYFKEWILLNGRNKFTMLLIPREKYSEAMPPAFQYVLNKRLTISNIMNGYYILLEMCGMHCTNDDYTMLLSDTMKYRPEYGLPGELHERS